MVNKSLIGASAREKALRGMAYLAGDDGIVKKSLGPYGLNGFFERGGPKSTNDGYTLSKEYLSGIKDEFERMGARILHEASAKTNDQVGDATTTSEILAYEIAKQCAERMPIGGLVEKFKPSELIEQIKTERDEVIKKLEEGVKHIKTEKEMINSAKISVEDDELAQLIGKTQWELGADGVILAEETNDYKCSIDRIKGIKFDNGFGSSGLITNQEKQTMEVEDCYVIMTNYVLMGSEILSKVQKMPDGSNRVVENGVLMKLIQNLIHDGKKKIAIIARSFSSEAIQACLQWCQEGKMEGIMVLPINAPYVDQKQVMLDIQSVLGGKYIDKEEMKLEDIGTLEVGFAKKIICERFSTIITGSDKDPTMQSRVDDRVEELKKTLKGSQSEFEKKNLQARIGQLTNGFAVLKVGAETEVERKRKFDKSEDSVNAVRLAARGGTIKGAGLAFYEVAKDLPMESLLKKPLMAIYEQIKASAPKSFKVSDTCRDPFLVLKAALINACSVAGTIASINGLVTQENPHVCKCAKAVEEENGN